jgi:PAS domain S-box-containing protein/putative nucleotidyltransferase with HDIG domain
MKPNGILKWVKASSGYKKVDKKKPQKTQESNEFNCRQVLEAVPDSLIIVNAQGEILFTNASAVKMFGYPAREMLGKPVEMLIPSQFGRHGELRKAYQKKPRARPMGLDLVLVALHKNQTEFQVEVSLSPLETNGETHIIAVIRGISDFKRTEKEFQMNLVRYHQLLDNMLEGCQIINYDWQYIYVNNMAAAQGRLKPEEMFMHTMMDLYPGIGNTELFVVLQRCMQERIPLKMENKFEYPDGSKGWFDLSIEPVPEGIFILSVDITKRMNAEVALENTEAKFRTLVEQLPAITYIVKYGENVQPTFISPQIKMILGFSAEEWLADPDLWSNQLHPLDRDLVLAEFALRDKLSQPIDLDYRILTRAGEVRWVHDQSRLIVDENRHPQYAHGLIFDISERKQAEEALERSEERFRSLIENSADAITLIDPEGVAVYDSPAAPGMLGYEPGELIGHNVLDFIHPGDLLNVRQVMRKLMEYPAERANIVFRFHHKNGLWRWIEAVATNLLAEPSIKAIVVNYRDITDRKQAEAALVQSENRYRTLFEDSPISLWEEDFSKIKQRVDFLRQQGVTDFKSYFSSHPEVVTEWIKLVRVVDVNKSAVKLYQTGGKEELLSGLATVLGEHAVEYFQDELLAIAEGSTQYSREGTELTLTGERIDVQISWSAASSYEDDLSKIIVSVVDLTERKKTEEIIKARTDELLTLYDLSRALADADDLESILNLVNRHAVESVHTTFSRIALLDGDKFVIRSAYPIRALGHDLLVGNRILLNSLSCCRRILEQNDPVVLQADDPQIGDEERAILLFDFIKSYCLIPLRIGGTSQNEKGVLGMLMLGEARDENREPFNWYKIRLAQSIGDQAATAIRRMLLHEQTMHQLQNLRALSDIDSVIVSTADVNTSLDVVLLHVIEQLNVDAASVSLFNQASGKLSHMKGRGFVTDAFEQGKELYLGEGFAGRVVLEHRMIHIPDLAIAKDEYPRFARPNADEGFVSYYGTPLIAKGKVVGVLEIFHRSLLEPDEDWLEFLQTLAGQTAIAIDNAELFTNLERSNMELILAYESTLEGWSAALDLRDKETEGHTQRVTAMTLNLAREMGMKDLELGNIRRGALLHDIGKMGVPDHILLKPDKLTDEEWVSMRKHPIFAYEMLSRIAYLHDALDIPYCHHEKWDGTGYPRGLKDQEIPLAARIFAVVDIYDALTSDRPYRKGWSHESTLEHIRTLSGSHLDPEVVRAFLVMLEQS